MKNRIHIVVGLFLIASFSLLLWQLRANVGDNQLTRAAYAQDSITSEENLVATCTFGTQGDANCDNKVDGNDYAIWRAQFKGEKAAGDADFNDDGKVDMKDFEIWRRGMATVTPINPTTAPTIAPTCVPLPECVNDPVEPCAVRPPYEGYYCPAATPTVSTEPANSCQCDLGAVTTNNCSPNAQPVCTGRFTCACQTQTAPTVSPTPTIALTPVTGNVPACSECGTAFGTKQGSICGSQIVCTGTQSCTEVPATCTVNGVSNPNCYRAQCSNTGGI